MRTRLALLLAVMVTALLIAAPANAVVSYTTTGGGTALSADVATAFGWSDADLQARGPYVTFTLKSARTSQLTCRKTTDSGKTFSVMMRRSQTATATVPFTLTRASSGMHPITGFHFSPVNVAAMIWTTRPYACPAVPSGFVAIGAPIVSAVSNSLWVTYGTETHELLKLA